MEKEFITPEQLLKDAYLLALNIYRSEFHPTFLAGVWRGGAPIAIAVHELLDFLGIKCGHLPIKISSYDGLNERSKNIVVQGMTEFCQSVNTKDRVLIVDDVHDTGLSLDHLLTTFKSVFKASVPEIRIATTYFKPKNNRTNNVPDFYVRKVDNWLVFPHELQGLSIDELEKNKPELSDILLYLKNLQP